MTHLFSEWTTFYRRFNDSAKAAAKKQTGSGKHIPERVQMEHLPFKQRVEQVSLFRSSHQKFVQREVLKEVVPSDGSGLGGIDARHLPLKEKGIPVNGFYVYNERLTEDTLVCRTMQKTCFEWISQTTVGLLEVSVKH